ncbi:MAG: glycosyltransferase family 39 protein [Elusimicrobiota bacterium]
MIFSAALNVVVGVHIVRNFPDIARSFDTSYYDVAKNVYERGAFSVGETDLKGNLLPTAYRTPVYPYMYVALFRIVGTGQAADRLMRVVFAILGVGTVWLTYRIGLFFSYRAGCLAASLAALDLNAVFFVHELDFPDVPLAFLTTLSLYFLMLFLRDKASYRNIALSSLFLGVGALTKPVVYLLWAPLAVFLGGFLVRLRGAAWTAGLGKLGLFMAIQAVFIGGWTVRNLDQVGYLKFVTMEGQHMLFWNANHLVAYQEGIDYSTAKRKLMDLYMTPAMQRLDIGAQDQYFGMVGRKLIFASPLDYAMVLLRRTPVWLLGTPHPDFLFSRATRDRLIRLRLEEFPAVHHARFSQTFRVMWSRGYKAVVGLGFFMKFYLAAVYILAFGGMFFLLRNSVDRWTLAALLLFVAYFAAVCNPVSAGRYRLPVMPVFFLLAALAAQGLWSKWAAGRFPSQ